MHQSGYGRASGKTDGTGKDDTYGKCGLAGTIVSQDCHKAAFLNLQIHMIQGALYFLYLPLFIASYIIKYKIDRFYDIHVFFLHSMSA